MAHLIRDDVSDPFFSFEDNHHFRGVILQGCVCCAASLTSCETPPCRWSMGPIFRGMKVGTNVAQLNFLGRFPNFFKIIDSRKLQ